MFETDADVIRLMTAARAESAAIALRHAGEGSCMRAARSSGKSARCGVLTRSGGRRQVSAAQNISRGRAGTQIRYA